MRDKIFYAVCFGFLLGILARSFVFLDLAWVFLFLVISLAVFLFFIFVSRNPIGILLSFLCLAFSLGVFRFHVANLAPPAAATLGVDSEVALVGRIIEDPNLRENNQQVVLELQDYKKIKILLSLGLEDSWAYGDVLQVNGRLEKPQNFITEQGKLFDYENYLRKDGILYVMRYPATSLLSRGEGSILKRALLGLKHKLLGAVKLAVPQPESLLLGGLILGERSEFPEDMRQNFIDTGTIHIVALSGYNITIVSEWLMKMFYFLPQAWGIVAGIVSIGLFVLMTGAGATSLRAGIMAVLGLFARGTGRNYDAGRALVFAAVAMVFVSPLILRYDVSFQLSFLATIAVIFFAPKIEKYFYKVPKFFGLREAITISAAAYVFVLPFILYKMGNLSLVALPANFLILPFIPATMALGFLTAISGTLLPIVSLPLGFLSSLFLSYELSVIKFLAGLPFAAINFPSFPLVLTLLIYAWLGYKIFSKAVIKLFNSSTPPSQNLIQ